MGHKFLFDTANISMVMSLVGLILFGCFFFPTLDTDDDDDAANTQWKRFIFNFSLKASKTRNLWQFDEH